MTNQASKGRPQSTATPNYIKFQLQIHFLVFIVVKNSNLKVDPLGKDVGNKSIGGFSQGEGNGNHVSEMK